MTKLDTATLRAVLDMIAEMPACTDADWRYELECRLRLAAAPRPVAERCNGRYPVGHRRDEPFDVTYRCEKLDGHDGPCGRVSDRPEPIGGAPIDRSEPIAPPPPPAEARDVDALLAENDSPAVNDARRPAWMRADDLAAAVRALRAQVQALEHERDELKQRLVANEAAWLETQEVGIREATRAGLDRAIALVEQCPRHSPLSTPDWIEPDPHGNLLIRDQVLAALRAARDKEA